MKTRGIKDLYLPKRIAKHVKFLLFCAVFTPIWGLIINVELTINFLLYTFTIMYIGMEVVYAISQKILKLNLDHTQSKITWRDIVRKYLVRLVLFYVASILVLILIAVLFVFITHLMKGDGIPPLSWFPEIALGMLKGAGIGLFFALPIFFFVPWQQSLKREFELREQNLIFQNETLKSQVNPHFLFNSLNTLSSLINNEVELANRFIGKLSLIYRYILDNSVKTKISNELLRNVEFNNDYSIIFGLFLDLPILCSYYSFHPEIYFQKNTFSYHSESENKTNDVIINASNLNLPILFRYTYPSLLIRPYLNIGSNFSFNYRNENAIYQANISNDIIEIYDVKESIFYSERQIGYIVGGGFQYKINNKNSIFIELRFIQQFATNNETMGTGSFQFFTGINL